MKKILFTLTIIALTISGMAQITITSSNIAPTGTTIVTANDTMPDTTIIPGDAGENRVWDFSALNEHTYDTVYTLSSSQTPFAGDFPDANYVYQSLSDADTLYIYNNLSDDGLVNLGYAGYSSEFEDSVVVEVVPQEILIDFPMQYGDHRDENFYYQYVTVSPVPTFDSLKIKHSETKSVDVDAWGSVTIPRGTFNVLRSKTVRYTSDSAWVLFLGTWTFINEEVDTSVVYDWYSDEVDPGFTLVSIDYSGDTVNDASYLLGTLTGVENIKNREVNIFPNPVTGELRINLTEPVSGNLSIYNTMGQLTGKETVKDASFVKTDISGLPPGNYILVITDNGSSKKYTSRFIKR